MGYNTDYYLTASPVDKELHEKIEQVLDERGLFIEAYDTGSWGDPDDTWYEHTEDMLEISKLFPDVLFRLHGIGEASDDVWTEYYKNGLMQACPVYETEWPIIPYRWTGMHREGPYNLLTCDIKTTPAEDRMDSRHNALYQCIGVLRDNKQGPWEWDKDLLDRALAVMEEFMRQEGIPIEQPPKEGNPVPEEKEVTC